MRRFLSEVAVMAFLGIVVGGAPALAQDRQGAPDKYKWDLTQLYKDPATWEAAKDAFAKRIPEIASFKGKLGDSASVFYSALDTYANMDKELSKIYSYASFAYDLDTRDSAAQQRVQAIGQVAGDFGTAASYITPEILAVGKEKVDGFVAAEPKLKPFVPFLDNILRMKAHTLSPAEEHIAALAQSKMGGAPSSIYGIFTNADMPYPEVTLPNGEKIRLDAQAYTKYRALDDRAERDMVFKEFWNKYGEFKRTLGTTLYSAVKAHTFNKEARGYDSCLQAALDRDNIPTTVYTQLISDVNSNLSTLHRYLKLRQRMMGVDQLRYEDLYANIVKGVDKEYTAEEAMKLVLQAVAPLGKSYQDTLSNGFYNERWVDFFPTQGKRSGAYSSGSVYDLHPYELLNYMGRYEDVSTLAHESGHSMHSYLSNTHQPYVTADYSIFVAEVASTCNENLLLHYMLNNTKDDATRLSLLGNYLDGLRQTLFRQTLFAEFELKIHEMVEQGQPLTGDSLNKLYLGLLKKYYGDEAGFCKVDDRYAVEWAYIPHFYRNFYVFEYATSIIASTSIANAIRQEAAAKKPSTKARDAYMKMLSSGSSEYPVQLLKDAGVDMTTSVPFAAAMKEMNSVMDEMEAILARQKK